MVVIVDYEAGNLRSVQRACARVGVEARIAADPDELLRADRVIFPGVGSAASAVDTLRERRLDEALTEVFRRGTPLLGICLGTQIVLDRTEEDDRQCLGLVAGVCRRFRPRLQSFKVPHMGWNGVRMVRAHPLVADVRDGDEFYFVHSYYPCPADERHVVAVTDYDGDFCSVLARDNLFATQFHVEKSGNFGLGILQRFARWAP
jgi:glutamine amidotransferase